MKRGNALAYARRSFRPLERQLVFRQRLVYFVVLVVKLGLDLFLRELVDARVSEDVRFDFFRHGLRFPLEISIEQREEIQDRAVFAGNVERDTPLDKADSVWVVTVGNDESNASFSEILERFWVFLGLVAGSLLEKVIEAPGSNKRDKTRHQYDEMTPNSIAHVHIKKKKQLQRLQFTASTEEKLPRSLKRQLG